MHPLPPELITLFCSSAFGGIMQLWARSIEARRQERLYSMHALQQHFHKLASPAVVESRGFQWTRRVIALLAVLFVIVFPKVLAVWMPDLPVHVGYPQHTPGFLFFSGVDKIKWVTMHGLVITPLDTHLLSAIIGLYFGGSLAGHR